MSGKYKRLSLYIEENYVGHSLCRQASRKEVQQRKFCIVSLSLNKYNLNYTDPLDEAGKNLVDKRIGQKYHIRGTI